MEIGDNLTDKAKYDYKLVRAAVDNGDQKAYAELMSRYRDAVFYMLLKMVSNKDDADDLTMEAFARAFSRLDQYTPSFAFSTWLFKIASNNCIDFIRKKKNHSHTVSLDKPFEYDDGTESSMDAVDNTLTPEERAIKKERFKQLHEVVETLKPRYRELVKLRYFDELSYEEIAVKLNLPLGSVKGNLFKSRELLYNILNGSSKKK